MASPSSRTLQFLRENGYMVGMVERFLSHAGHFGVRQDLFGLFDLLAVKPDEGIIGVQCFTTAWAEHYEKFYQSNREEAITWLKSGGKIELWGWRKLKLFRKSKAIRWTPRIELITLETYGESA
jgi:hypothetical protein